MSSTTRALCLASLALCLGMAAAGAQEFPIRPIRMVVPYAAGGLPDTMTRLAAQKITESLGQQIVVDNRPGAGGIGACELVARGNADGYTLLVADVAQTAINPALYAKLPYDSLRDFTPVIARRVATKSTLLNSASLTPGFDLPGQAMRQGTRVPPS